jgi:phytoene dehydrogenase-like protein
MIPLERRPTGGIALALTLAAHVGGWCIPRGGAQRLTNALAAHFRSLGGEIVTDTVIRSIDELPLSRAVLCDLSPRLCSGSPVTQFPPRFRRALARYRLARSGQQPASEGSSSASRR